MPPDKKDAPAPETVPYKEARELIEKAYQDGYQAGLAAGKPVKPLFEHARDTALREFQVDQFGNFDRNHLKGLLHDIELERGEKLSDADKALIASNVEREVVVRRARSTVAAKPRALTPSERSSGDGRKPTEYEVVR